MKVTVFEIEDWERAAFRTLAHDHDLGFVAEPLSTRNAAAHAGADVVSTFIYSELSAKVLETLGRPRLIATRSTGYDHIDTAYCGTHGIRVANVPSYGKNTVAEHTFALLLAVSHRIVEAVERARRGTFSPEGLQGFDLRGKTIGIVGTGDIGLWVARIANGFGMSVLGFDVQPDERVGREIGLRYVLLDELLRSSDVVSLHVPLNERTRHLIGRDQLAQMKDGAVLLNTARGEIVDAEALVEALHSRKLSAAGIDVLPEEPAIREEAELLRRAFHERHDLRALLANQILLRMPNVVVTPHSAFNTREAVERILATTVENIEAFARGEARNLVVDAGPRR